MDTFIGTLAGFLPVLFGQTLVQRNSSLCLTLFFSFFLSRRLLSKMELGDERRGPKTWEITLGAFLWVSAGRRRWTLSSLTGTEPNYRASLKLHLFPLKTVLTFYFPLLTVAFLALCSLCHVAPMRAPSDSSAIIKAGHHLTLHHFTFLAPSSPYIPFPVS